MTFQKIVPFGNTGLEVCRIGISAGYGLDASGVEEAVDHGANYLFFGSMRRPSFGEGIKRVVKKGRDKVIIVLQTYWRGLPRLQTWDIERGLCSLGLDYADVMLMGWFNSPPGQRLIDEALKLKEAGKIKLLGISTHNRKSVPPMAKSGVFDLFHIRYNAAHRGAEQDIFPHVDPVSGPGMVAFTATRWGQLLNPKKMPPGEAPLRAADAYRFCLSNPHIHTITTGPKNRAQLQEALSALEKGPLDHEEMARVKMIGDYLYRKKSVFGI
ncbi:aldo/keto reductase [candidate division CSSED10-310 bacterium]|uniref:Aldo/keto reductase n=1 Tax=candidate division CSSED10-310 bacterium TaxID=2855610 RepID=A0ABV6YY54_UNCC1